MASAHIAGQHLQEAACGNQMSPKQRLHDRKWPVVPRAAPWSVTAQYSSVDSEQLKRFAPKWNNVFQKLHKGDAAWRVVKKKSVKNSFYRYFYKTVNVGGSFFIHQTWKSLLLWEFHLQQRHQLSNKRFINFPHCCPPHMTLPLWLFSQCWHCTVQFFLFTHVYIYKYLVPYTAIQYLWDHQAPILFIWHLSSSFVSHDGFVPTLPPSPPSPLPIPAASQRGEKASGLLAIVYQPTPVSLSLAVQSLVGFSSGFFCFFFKQEPNSFGAWEKLLSEEIILMFVFTQWFPCYLEEF